jgi:UDP:flavonoid glycosyltransferase YjiC (YdhE family)
MPELPPDTPLRSEYNLLSYALVDQALCQVMSEAMRDTGPWPIDALARQTDGCAMYGFSPSVVPRPMDWGESVHVTGYWFLEPSCDWQPARELKRFLSDGPPPVYVGFGSMVGECAHETMDIILQALEMSGQRGILATGWGGIGNTSRRLPDHVFVIDAVPHAWLFPQMAAVVHHGGGGTTAEGLRSGVPSIVIPYVVDQFFWGERVAQLGAGPTPLPRTELTPQRLAQRINEALSSDPMRECARILGEKISREDGVERAVQTFESEMARCIPLRSNGSNVNSSD